MSSRIPRMVSPERQKAAQHQQDQFSRRLTPPSSVRRGNRMDAEEKGEEAQDGNGGVLLEAQLAARVRMQQQHKQKQRRGSDPLLANSKAKSSDELATHRKTSAPSSTSQHNIVSPSRIPVAQDYLSNSSGNLAAARSSRSPSKSVDGGGSSRNSPVRQVSPPRRISRSGIPQRLSVENLNNGEREQSEDSKTASSNVSRSGSNGNNGSARPIPSPRTNVPTLGFSFSPERMLPAKQNSVKSKSFSSSSEDDGQMVGVEICSEQEKEDPGGRKTGKRRFEAFVMTGDRMIQLAKTPANQDFKSKYTKSVSDSCISSSTVIGQQQQQQARLAEVEEEEGGVRGTRRELLAETRLDDDRTEGRRGGEEWCGDVWTRGYADAYKKIEYDRSV